LQISNVVTLWLWNVPISMNDAHELLKSLVKRKQNRKKNETLDFFPFCITCWWRHFYASFVVVDDQTFFLGAHGKEEGKLSRHIVLYEREIKKSLHRCFFQFSSQIWICKSWNKDLILLMFASLYYFNAWYVNYSLKNVKGEQIK
jgi:hypothetical protein